MDEQVVQKCKDAQAANSVIGDRLRAAMIRQSYTCPNKEDDPELQSPCWVRVKEIADAAAYHEQLGELLRDATTISSELAAWHSKK